MAATVSNSCLLLFALCLPLLPSVRHLTLGIDHNLENETQTLDFQDFLSNVTAFNETVNESSSNTTQLLSKNQSEASETNNSTASPPPTSKSWPSKPNWSRKLKKNESLHPLSIMVTPNYPGVMAGIQLGSGSDDKQSHHHVQLVGGGNSKDSKEYLPCRRPARCEPMNRTFCYGTTLNYRATSFDLVNGSDVTSHSDIQRLLAIWHNLQNFPKCWSVVQNLLCAVLVPRCEHGIVDLPNLEMCRVTRGPCRMVEATVGWPSYLRCDNEGNFPHFCKAEARELRFVSNSNCPRPLVTTDSSSSWYDGWEGCGLDCHDPLYTKDDHKAMHLFIGVGSGLCLVFSLFTVLTFFIDWKSANKYPALIIFYINWCFLIASIGWLAQFTPGARDDIVCRRDGTLRKFEPSSGENLSCVIVFVMIYYFSMAASIWFVMLTYSWYVSFKVLGKIRDAIDAKTAYFHLVAWSLPLVLTITILALAQVDGDSISGICFVGHSNMYSRVGFVLVPITVILAIGGFYLLRGFVVLVRLKIGSEDLISVKASAKLRDTIIRIATFAALVFLFVVTTYVCHIYEYTNRDDWNLSLRRYISCKSNLTRSVLNSGGDDDYECFLDKRPNVGMVQLHLLCVFGSGIVMSTWVWTSSTIDAWKRFLRRAFDQPINEPVKLTKHKMIAKAFAKRRDMRGSRLSFSFQSTHDDPLGMNFDFNSCASQEISSTWQAALPKFITRRGAFMGAGALGLRRNSSASEVSQMRQSIDSHYTRRHSLDSQISFHMSDRERRAYMVQARQQRRKKKRRNRGTFGSSQVLPWAAAQAFEQQQQQRRGSDASQQSDFGPVLSQQFFQAMKKNNIEKAARQLENSKVKRPRSSFMLPINLLTRQKKSSKRNSGRRNFGFVRGLDTSSEDGGDMKLATAEKLSNGPLPGQIDGDDVDMKIRGNLASFKSKSKVADDMRSVASTDNESLHKLGEQLSSSILLRAMRDSQSDLEMGTFTRNYPSGSGSHSKAKAGSNRSNKSQTINDTALNNTRRSGRNAIVDLAMDSDNRDTSSS